MKKKDYSHLIEEILLNVGGKDNIETIMHCSTRLRINIKDKGLVKEEAFKTMEGVVDGRWSNGQFQVIIGTHVLNLYSQMCSQYGFEAQDGIDENLDQGLGKKSVKDMLKGILPAIAECCTGIIYPLMGMSILNLIVQLLIVAGLLTEKNATAQTITWMWNATLTFCPILVAYTASRRFKTNSALAIFIACLMTSPSFTALVEGGNAGSIFGLPIYPGTYTSSILPAIIIVYVLSIVEKTIRKYTPTSLNLLLLPTLTLAIMLPLTFVVLAPIGTMLGELLANVITRIDSMSHIIALTLYAMLRPVLVFTGMHVSLNGIFLPSLIQNGMVDNLVLVPVIMANFSQGACGLAVAAKTKNKTLRTAAASAGIQPFLIGITEPVTIGINVPLKTPLYCSLAANVVGGLILGFFNVFTYTMVPNGGVFGFTAFLGGSTLNIIVAIVSAVVAAIVGFVLTFIFYKDKEPVEA